MIFSDFLPLISHFAFFSSRYILIYIIYRKYKTMKKIFYIIVFIFVSCFLSQTFANTYIERYILGHTVKVIEYDLSSDIYDFEIVATQDANDMRSLVLENNGFTGINGVFFCPDDYTQCGDKSYTINERYIKWEKISTYKSTWDRVVFGFDKQNKSLLFQTDRINTERELEIYQGFANFPLLMQDWNNVVEFYHDKWLIDKKMLVKIPRNFICTNKEKTKMYFGLVYDISLDRIPVILERLWCSDALNLDAGWSTAFVYNWGYVAWPGRDILDGIVIKRKWFDVSVIEDKAKKLSRKIDDIITDTMSLDKQISILWSLDTKLKQIRKNIYNKYTTETINQWNVNIWYEIEISSLKWLQDIYLINALQYHLREVKKSKVDELYEINKFLKTLE